jgi:DNA helicase-2/ATP-dependent DNA helicase PcrA
VFERYEKRLQSNNAMDFDDILSKLLQALHLKIVLDMYHERYEYIMVDEYQDTNLIQYEIVALLASKLKNLAVV